MVKVYMAPRLFHNGESFTGEFGLSTDVVLKSDFDRALEVIRFYAETKNYTAMGAPVVKKFHEGIGTNVTRDHGSKARAFIKECE